MSFVIEWNYLYPYPLMSSLSEGLKFAVGLVFFGGRAGGVLTTELSRKVPVGSRNMGKVFQGNGRRFG